MHKKHITILVLTFLVFLTACAVPVETPGEPTPDPTMAEVTRRTTPMKVCTPPPCENNEAYHCPDECIGGCGTVCATHTPEPTEDKEDPTQDNTSQATPSINVQVFPNTSNYTWQPVVAGLDKPLSLSHAGDGSNRLFILEQPGRIRILKGSGLLDQPFLDINQQVVDQGNEQGLLGLAFHPDYEQNGFLFLNYTGSGGDTIISRFQVSEDPDIANAETEVILLRIPQPYRNHNGGHLIFGPDGNLYIGTGDGGAAGDPKGNAQDLSSLLGKMLRIDVDHGEPYAIPADNPYVSADGLPEIWAYGLRNPWRFEFDRVTGDLYIADVGQNQWEEVNYLPAGPNGGVPVGGSNFGWDFWEGTHPFEGSPPQGNPMVAPIWEYNHTQGCSITGGPVYRGAMAAWQGIYFFGDYCSGMVWGLLQDESGTWKQQALFQTNATITSFGEDEAGEIYLIDRAGILLRLVESP